MEATTLKKSSSIPSFYKLSVDERLRELKDFAGLSEEEVRTLQTGTLPFASAERMIENVVGIFPIHWGLQSTFSSMTATIWFPWPSKSPQSWQPRATRPRWLGPQAASRHPALNRL